MTTSVILTAVVIACLVFAGQGVLKWAFSILDVFVPVSKAPDKLRSFWSSKSKRAIVVNSLFFLVSCFNLVSFALDKGPVTRLTVLYGGIFLITALGSLFLSDL